MDNKEKESIDTSHIISDVLAINMEIINTYAKFPRFISFLLEKRARKKLIDLCEKIRNSNKALLTANVLEFMSYIYNNYSEFVGHDKRFNGVADLTKSTIADYDVWEILLTVDDSLSCNISIDMKTPKYMIVNIIANNSNGVTSNYNFQCQKLYSSNRDFGDYCNRINSHILGIMSDFLIDILESFDDKKSR